MIVTEKEAGKKNCLIAPHAYKYCLGSACMAWRWESDENEVILRISQDGPPPGDGWERLSQDASINIYWKRPWGNRRTGYCGRAPILISE